MLSASFHAGSYELTDLSGSLEKNSLLTTFLKNSYTNFLLQKVQLRTCYDAIARESAEKVQIDHP